MQANKLVNTPACKYKHHNTKQTQQSIIIIKTAKQTQDTTKQTNAKQSNAKQNKTERNKNCKKIGFGGSQSVWNTPGDSEKYGEQHTKVPRRSPKKQKLTMFQRVG